MEIVREAKPMAELIVSEILNMAIAEGSECIVLGQGEARMQVRGVLCPLEIPCEIYREVSTEFKSRLGIPAEGGIRVQTTSSALRLAGVTIARHRTVCIPPMGN